MLSPNTNPVDTSENIKIIKPLSTADKRFLGCGHILSLRYTLLLQKGQSSPSNLDLHKKHTVVCGAISHQIGKANATKIPNTASACMISQEASIKAIIVKIEGVSPGIVATFLYSTIVSKNQLRRTFYCYLSHNLLLCWLCLIKKVSMSRTTSL